MHLIGRLSILTPVRRESELIQMTKLQLDGNTHKTTIIFEGLFKTLLKSSAMLKFRQLSCKLMKFILTIKSKCIISLIDFF